MIDIKVFLLLLIFAIVVSCDQKPEVVETKQENYSSAYVQVVGVAQDAGYPQLGCTKSCCAGLWDDQSLRKMVSCIAIVDPANDQYWLFDATPDIKDQIESCQLGSEIKMPEGIFLTHAHMGHYTGLMQLGREAYGAKNIKVYSMPRMHNFLKDNGPWGQLVALENIDLVPIESQKAVDIRTTLQVIPILVPHRDEYSETVGYKIIGVNKKVLFIPDIDKWSKWDLDILDEIRSVDVAFLDGSFFKNGEIPNRDMSQIPHPFIEESMSLFSVLSEEDKAKVHFIHFNHTNPVLKKESQAYQEVVSSGFNIADEGQKILL